MRFFNNALETLRMTLVYVLQKQNGLEALNFGIYSELRTKIQQYADYHENNDITYDGKMICII